MRILIVKTSSMGDVVHALPAVSDMLCAQPGLQVDWLVEAPFAAIPRLHAGVQRVLPLAWRKWRKTLFAADTRAAMAALRGELRRERYDWVLDLQGLLKSVLWGLQAKGPLLGYGFASIREPAAALFYRRRATVSRALQAVERNRRLAAAHLGYPMPDSAPDFGTATFDIQSAASRIQAATTGNVTLERCVGRAQDCGCSLKSDGASHGPPAVLRHVLTQHRITQS